MRLHTEQSYWWRSKFLSECAWIVTCVHARTYASMLGDVIRACMAREILVQLSTDTHEFEKYSRGATKYTRVTRTRASSLNRAVPYHICSYCFLISIAKYKICMFKCVILCTAKHSRGKFFAVFMIFYLTWNVFH